MIRELLITICLGYLTDSEIAQQIVECRYTVADDVNDATALIINYICRLGVQLTSGDLKIDISPEDFQYFWKGMREGTASSYSGIHYGHYKSAVHSDRFSEFLSKEINLIARTGCPPDHWSYSLTTMLEKVVVITLVNKLRAVLFMVANFNFHNKLIFGDRMLTAAREAGLIPAEQYSERQSTVEDGTFDKVLQADISRQFRQRMGIVSADAANCYDLIHHAIMALIFLSFCVGR